MLDFFRPKKREPEFEILAQTETPYNHVFVTQRGNNREMWFKGAGSFFLQSRVDIKSRKCLSLVYSRMLMASLLFQPAPRRILMVGLGGGAITNCLHEWFPETQLDVVEIDAQVIELCKKYFFLKETGNYWIHEVDGRLFVRQQRGKEPYDLVYLDAFKSGSIPFHLKTREFYREILDILAPEGVVGSNLYGKSNSLKPGDRQTFAALFKQIYCFEDPEKIATVLIATNREWVWSREDMLQQADMFQVPVLFPMREVVETYKPDKFIDNQARIFEDDFSKAEMVKAIEKNNKNSTLFRAYPIKSTHGG